MTSPADSTERPLPVDGEEAVEATAEPVDERSAFARSTKSVIEWIAVIVCALTVALVVKTYLVQAFYIPSGSMRPTLEVSDRVLVNKLDKNPSRGDVVVFDRPGGAGPDGISDLIKRVVGLEGETIEGRDGNIYIDGRLLDEPYLPDGARSKTFGPVTISPGHVWMLGDNRLGSADSTQFGEVPVDTIDGRAFIVIWPPSAIGGL